MFKNNSKDTRTKSDVQGVWLLNIFHTFSKFFSSFFVVDVD